MSVRSYSGLLVFEDIFDYVPATNPDVSGLASIVFTPNVPVVSGDCGTTLGFFQTVNYELEGAVELSTGLIISKARIDQLLYTGTYEVATRSLSTCIAPEGVCQTCYAATVINKPVPNIGSRVIIQPEYLITTDVINGTVGDISEPLTLATTAYQFMYVYMNGVLILPSQYTVSGQTLTFNTPLSVSGNVVVHYTALNTSPFLVYLAQTYSGAILGMLPLPAPQLPIRSLLISSLIPQSKLATVVQYTQEIKAIPANYITYIDSINDTLELTLYIIALNSIYSNVTS
jgi:hypothetical protein